RYGQGVQRMLRTSLMVMAVYLGLILLTGWEFNRVPKGFIPAMDQQYFITLVQLPPGSSLSRTDAVVQNVLDIALEIEGVENAISFTGLDASSFTNASNSAVVFLPLEDFDVRREKGIDYQGLLGNIRGQLSQIDNAIVLVIPPPSVSGIGNAGGFKMMVQDRGNLGTERL